MVKHLALVHNPDYFPDRDYKSVADEIRKRCDDIKVFIFPDMEVVPQLAELSENPLMTFCPSILHYFKAPRGKVFCGQKIRKDEQLRLLAKGGVRVPRWVYFKPHLQLSEREWGPFVIIKPVQFGYATKGRDIELVRTAAFKSLPLAMMKIEGRIQSVKIVQQFIDSGEHSEDFRVVTIFGRTLYALRRKSLVKLQRPEGSAIKTSEGVVSNAAAGTPREVAYCYDKEILAFAAASIGQFRKCLSRPWTSGATSTPAGSIASRSIPAAVLGISPQGERKPFPPSKESDVRTSLVPGVLPLRPLSKRRVSLPAEKASGH